MGPLRALAAVVVLTGLGIAVVGQRMPAVTVSHSIEVEGSMDERCAVRT